MRTPAALAAILLATSGCLLLDKSPNAVPEVLVDYVAYEGCASRPSYEAVVERVLSNSCAICHRSQSNFILTDDPLVNYVRTLKQLSDDDGGDANDNPLLIKARGGDGHGGGPVLQETSDGYGAIALWILEERASACSP